MTPTPTGLTYSLAPSGPAQVFRILSVGFIRRLTDYSRHAPSGQFPAHRTTRLTAMLEPGAWVGNRGSAFKIDVPPLTLREEPLVTEQQRGTLAEPGLELRVEGEGVEEGSSLRRVVFRAIEDWPPAAARGRDNFPQTLARIAVRDDLNGVEARRL